jgi:peroxiredoxin Q/BCP
MTYEGSKLSARNTYLIDPSGKVAKVFTGVKPASHSEEVLAALATLQKS